VLIPGRSCPSPQDNAARARQELDAIGRNQVMKQTTVPIFRKILSLFERSTEIIRKGKAGKLNEFGKMVKLQEAEDQIVIDYEAL
jgi:IS5 family transposase